MIVTTGYPPGKFQFPRLIWVLAGEANPQEKKGSDKQSARDHAVLVIGCKGNDSMNRNSTIRSSQSSSWRAMSQLTWKQVFLTKKGQQ
jgi:hypothetical protein